MQGIKKQLGGLAGSLFEALVGILLLINPVAFTSGIIVGAGVILCIGGLGFVSRYFRKDAVTASLEQDLSKGLIMLLLGVFCIVKSEWFVATFPVLTMLYGACLLVLGVGKIQWTVDVLRMKGRKWYLPALSAAISLVCGAVILASPFKTVEVLWTFTSVTIIVDAVFDIVSILSRGRERSENT